MASEVVIGAVTIDDVVDLAVSMREADLAEIYAAGANDPLDCVAESVGASSESWSARFDGDIACVWGVVPIEDSILGSRVGNVWMLTSKNVDLHKMTFARECCKVLPDMLNRWDVLYCWADAKHEQTLAWWRFLGFEPGDPEPLFDGGEDFRQIILTKDKLWVPQSYR